MYKVTKVFVGSALVFGTVLGLSSYGETSHNEAQALTTQPWYTYNGYTSRGGDFVLNQSFFNALKSGNIEFNGIKVNSKYCFDISSKKIYDQNFQQVNGNKANNVSFDIQNKSVSLKDIRAKYGNNFNYQPSLTGNKSSKSDGIYGYKVGKSSIVFYVNDGYVKSVTVS